MSSERKFLLRHKTTKKEVQKSFLGENASGYLGEFRHELPNSFLSSKKFFDYKFFYDMYFRPKKAVFIEEFCSKEQFQDINLNVFLRLNEMVEKNFEKLEVYAKRVVVEYVEIFKLESKDSKIIDPDFYKTINKALDPARTKGFYYLLIYSLYETGLIGVPRCIAAVEKILLNTITHTRLMAYIHNDEVREEIKPKKLFFFSKSFVKNVHIQAKKIFCNQF